jgi:hypothetical protein
MASPTRCCFAMFGSGAPPPKVSGCGCVWVSRPYELSDSSRDIDSSSSTPLHRPSWHNTDLLGAPYDSSQVRKPNTKTWTATRSFTSSNCSGRVSTSRYCLAQRMGIDLGSSSVLCIQALTKVGRNLKGGEPRLTESSMRRGSHISRHHGPL